MTGQLGGGAGYLNLLDMINGGGAGKAGAQFEGAPISGLLNALGAKPRGQMGQEAMAQVRPQMPQQMPQQMPTRKPPAGAGMRPGPAMQIPPAPAPMAAPTSIPMSPRLDAKGYTPKQEYYLTQPDVAYLAGRAGVGPSAYEVRPGAAATEAERASLAKRQMPGPMRPSDMADEFGNWLRSSGAGDRFLGLPNDEQGRMFRDWVQMMGYAR